MLLGGYHKYMDGNDYEDNDIDFHRFVIKMLELENEDIYWKILAQVRSSGEDYTGIRDWLLSEEKLKFKLFHEVLKSFEIGEDADDKKIKLFDDYIIRSAPSDILTLKYLGAAQKAYNIFQRIVNSRINLDDIEAHVFPTFEKIDIAKISPMEIASIFEGEEFYPISILSGFAYLRVGCQTNQNLNIYIDINSFKAKYAKDLIDNYNQTQNSDDKIRYDIYINGYHRFQNIKDTSSPDAPIYQILEKAGFIDNAYSLNNQESSSKVKV